MSSSDESKAGETGENTPFDESLYENDDDTMRILLSTDNHLGYNERDVIRGMDSFSAFEEVLYLAQKFNVDMVLLGGDLFHDNRPSRRTLYKTMEILRKYTLGPNPVRIQLLANYNFRNHNQRVNYLDPNYSIQLPLFSIHGNHDDPSRDQGGGELLAALDLLSMSNLINYFGRQDQVDKVEISPILLKKGDTTTTKLAIYGLGSQRDERLNRMWEQQKVKFVRPAQEEYFNIFVLHQNRDLGRGTKNCIQENMIPEWMDLVVWGHEHECLIEFFESVVGTFRITQPGSSVATSLVAGEAVPKKVGILDIRGKDFRLHPVPLTQVRSFVTSELSLREKRHALDPDDTNIEKKVQALLNEEVQLMVRKARQKRVETVRLAQLAGSDAGDPGTPLKYKLQNPDEVLVRIRVEHSGYTTLNNQRFGGKFIGEVANPSDILLFHRKKDPKAASTVKKASVQPLVPEELEKTNMEDLVRDHLLAPGSKPMKILTENRLSDALEDYVDKARTVAISETVNNLIEEKQEYLVEKNKGADVEALLSDDDDDDDGNSPEPKTKGTKAKSKKSTQKKRNQKDMDSSEDELGDSPPPPRKTKKKAAKSNTKASSQRAAALRAALDSSDDEVVQVEKPKPKGRSSRTTKRKVNYAQESDDEDASDAMEDDIEDFDDEELLVDEPKKRKRAAPKKTTPKRKAASKAPARSRYQDDDSDDSVEVVGGSQNLKEDWGSQATKSQGW